jgi:bacillithiol biosynthesis cysteine-adding enzyme BshC
VKIQYAEAENPPWNRIFAALRQNPNYLKAYLDVCDLSQLPEDLSPWRKTRFPRKELVNILRSQQAGPESSLSKLEDPESLVVITGQQPGLFGGPLYSLYKALTACQLAKKLSRDRKLSVVPVFCIASDDHDWGEANRFYHWYEGGWRRKALREEPEGATLFEKAHPGTGKMRELVSLEGAEIPRDPRFEGSFSESFRRLLESYFPEAPLVYFEARWTRRMAENFYRDIFNKTDLFDQQILMAGSALKLGGFESSLEARSGAFLMIERAGRRERLIRDDKGVWGTRHEKLGSADHIRKLIGEKVEIFSPNVVSRVLWMRHLFPVIADVVGPGEAAYQLQMQGIFRQEKLSAPLLFPRLSATLFRSREMRKLKFLKREAWQFHQPFNLKKNKKVDRLVAERLQGIFQLEKALERDVLEHYPELESFLKKTRLRMERDLSRIPSRIEKTEEIRQQESLAPYQALKAWCLPEGRLQERIVSIFGLEWQIGRDWWPLFTAQVDTLKKQSVYALMTETE